MRKIVSLYQRDYGGTRLVRDEVVPGAEWVLAGEGQATRKFDGTCCLVRDRRLFARLDLPLTQDYRKAKKAGYAGPTWEHVAPPELWEPAQESYDTGSGHWPGWTPVLNQPEYRWHREPPLPPTDGTYELIGPKVQGNPEHQEKHALVPHGAEWLHCIPLSFEGICGFLAVRDIEGIVWHHPDGRMVKIKTKDFGLKRGGGS